jgi:dipeptide/tripeptide permease
MTSTPTAATAGFLPRLRHDLAALRASPRELWIVYLVKLLESVAFFSVYNVLVVYLSEELGYTDLQASSLAGTWLTAISLLTFLSGFVADAMGVRRALLASIISCLVGRALITASHARPVVLAGLAVMSWGVASMMPTMTAGVRRYTTPTTVSFGFSLFYVMMNVGAVIAGPTVSSFRRVAAHPRTFTLPALGPVRLSSGQLIFAVGLLATLLAFALVLLGMRPDEHAQPAEPRPAASPARDGPLAIMLEVVRERTFWRFMLFVWLLVLVRLIFQHAHLTWPKYTLREFGPTFPFATYWSLNPAMIIVLTPVVTALTRHRSAFGTIVAGAFVSALSVFFMAASTTVAASVLFIVTLSLGEALWSPRLYEYTTVIAPRGREASYMGLSQVPMFAAKPLVGFLSGAMLSTWCPRTGPRDSSTMWLVIGAMTLVGPVLIVLLRGVIEPREVRAAASTAPR